MARVTVSGIWSRRTGLAPADPSGRRWGCLEPTGRATCTPSMRMLAILIAGVPPYRSVAGPGGRARYQGRVRPARPLDHAHHPGPVHARPVGGRDRCRVPISAGDPLGTGGHRAAGRAAESRRAVPTERSQRRPGPARLRARRSVRASVGCGAPTPAQFALHRARLARSREPARSPGGPAPERDSDISTFDLATLLAA